MHGRPPLFEKVSVPRHGSRPIAITAITLRRKKKEVSGMIYPSLHDDRFHKWLQTIGKKQNRTFFFSKQKKNYTQGYKQPNTHSRQQQKTHLPKILARFFTCACIQNHQKQQYTWLIIDELLEIKPTYRTVTNCEGNQKQKCDTRMREQTARGGGGGL